MKPLLAAFAFLTRLPLPSRWQFEAADVGRGAVFFPFVGLVLGAAACGVLSLLREVPRWVASTFSLDLPQPAGLPPTVVAILVVALWAWLTGALHLDGLADMADGFGGGYTRDDVLRIMRDHVIGAYGAIALILVIGLKVTALGSLIDGGRANSFVVLAPMLSRWASVMLGFALPYARREDSPTHKVPGGMGSAITDYVRWPQVIGATLLTALVTIAAAGWQGIFCWTGVVVITLMNAKWCRRRIGGITGDTMGANTEVCEAIVFVLALMVT